MRAVVQRTQGSRIVIDKTEAREVGPGLTVFLGVLQGDGEQEADFLAQKVRELRMFSDENGKMNLSLLDVGGEALVVSNFTLAADGNKGRRPSFDRAAPPDTAKPLYERFVRRLREGGVRQVETGEFGAHMDVLVQNDGPVTIILDTEKIMHKKQ